VKRWLMEHRFALTEMLTHIRHQPLSIGLNVLAVAVALALPWLGAVILGDLGPLSSQVAKNPEISVFVALDASRSDALALGVKLRALSEVEDARFIGRDTALEQMRQRPGMQAVLTALNQNPLPDAWVVRLRGAPASGEAPAALQTRVAHQISEMPRVAHVQLDSAWVERLDALLRLLRVGLVVVSTALAIAVVAVIFNTIRLQVLGQREEIEIARLFGATNQFIRRPFYYIGALQGLIGGLLALVMVEFALAPLNSELAELGRLYQSDFQFLGPGLGEILVFLVLACLLGWLAALLSVGRHLARSNP
jgi:cell division transport system permease protein